MTRLFKSCLQDSGISRRIRLQERCDFKARSSREQQEADKWSLLWQEEISYIINLTLLEPFLNQLKSQATQEKLLLLTSHQSKKEESDLVFWLLLSATLAQKYLNSILVDALKHYQARTWEVELSQLPYRKWILPNQRMIAMDCSCISMLGYKTEWLSELLSMLSKEN